MISSGSGNSEKTLKAMRSIEKATRERLLAGRNLSGNPARAQFHAAYAQDLLEEANSLMIPDHSTEITTGREVLPSLENRSLAGVRETLERPDTIGLEASSRRLDLLAAADVVSLGVDAAESINAHDSLEKMLAHQLAAAHKYALKHLALIDRTKDNLERLRLTNAAARR